MITRKIACYRCGKLVEATPSVDKPYAASSFTIDKHYGCICSNCLRELSKKDTILTANTANAKSQAPQNIQSKQSTMVENDRYRLNELKAITSKYPCLDYSLESFVDIVKSEVFGQDEATEKVVFTLYTNQFKCMLEDMGYESDELNHLLLIGSTGVGKTFLAETALKALEIPYARSNADAITSAGYIGDKVEAILERLYQAANNDLELAQNGVVVIDEIDKKRRSDSSQRDINGLAVQQELLKILEPNIVWINHGKTAFDTSHLTVILCGAFVGLDKIIKTRLYPQSIGFKSEESIDDDKLLKNVEPIDLVKYGFIEEFVGRAPTPIVLNNLSYFTILSIIQSKLAKKKSIFSAKNFELRIDELVLSKIACRVMEHNTGARDIKKELESLLYQAEYQVMNSRSGGSCDINENGDATVLYEDTKSKRLGIVELIGKDYLLEDEP